MPDFSMFFADFRPQLSPDGRYVVIPGLHSYPEYGVAGPGLWLLDLVAGVARQLLPDYAELIEVVEYPPREKP